MLSFPFIGSQPALSPVYPVDQKNKLQFFNKNYLPDVEHSVLDTATYFKKKVPLQSKSMAKELGWIKLHRSSFNNSLYFQEAFTRWQAWCDLLLLANHKDGCYRVRGIEVCVKRGQVGHTSGKLAERWKWSRGKIIRFLDELERDQQIVQQNSNVTSLISIVNYEKYQADGTANGTAENYQKNGTAYGTANGTAENEKTVQQTVQQNSSTTNSESDSYDGGFIVVGTSVGTTKVYVNGHQNGQQTVHKQECKEVKEEENRKKEAGVVPPPPPPESVPGFNYLPNGRSYIEKLIFYTPSDFNGLPTDALQALQTNLSVIKKVEVQDEELKRLWEGWKVLNLTFQKPYRNHEDVYVHFSNYCLKQAFRSGRTPSKRPKKEEKKQEKATPNLQNLANRYD